MCYQERKGRVGKEKEMPKSSGGICIIPVEINIMLDVPLPLNTLINSCVPCTCALVQFAALLS